MYRLTRMTNLLASIVITIVTNTTEAFPMMMVVAEPPETEYSQGVFSRNTIAYMKWVKDTSQNVKTNVTTCKEITTLRFDWNGPREVISERIIWQSNVVLRLDWTAKP